MGNVAQFQKTQIGEHAEQPLHKGQQARHDKAGGGRPEELVTGVAKQCQFSDWLSASPAAGSRSGS